MQPVGKGKHGFAGICYDGGQYWLTPRKNGSITRWDPKNNAFAELTALPHGFNGGGYPFIQPIYANRSIWLFPNQANQIIKIDVGNNRMESVDALATDIAPFSYSQLLDDKIVAVSSRENRLFEWEVGSAVPSEHKILVSKGDDVQMNRQGRFADYNNESFAAQLDGFCDYVLERSYLRTGEHRLQNQIGDDIVNPDGGAGHAIYQNCLQALQGTKSGVRVG